MDDDVLRQLAVLAEKLSFRPETQVREKRVMAYLADRNPSVFDVETLENLFTFIDSAVGIVAQAEAK